MNTAIPIVIAQRSDSDIPVPQSSVRQRVPGSGMVACVRGILIGCIGVLLLFYPLIGRSTKLWADDFDARLIGWIVEWGYHCVFQRLAPGELWNANSFYPHAHSLAFSDSLMGLLPFYAPLRLLGWAPIHALYGSLSGVVLAGTVALSLALHRAPHQSWQFGEQAWILWGALFSLSTTAFLYHYQLFGMYVAIPGAAFLLNYVCARRTGDLVGAVLCVGWSIAIATYAAPILGALILCFSPAILWVLWRDRLLLVRDWRRLGLHLLFVALVGAVLFTAQLRPYLQIQRQFPGSSGLTEAYAYSARVSSCFTGYSRNSFWYQNHGYAAYGDWERVLFPGYSLLGGVALYFGYFLLQVVNAAARWCSRFLKTSARASYVPWLVMDSGSAVPVVAMILLSTVIVLSFGPYADEQRTQQLPFFYLSKIIPGLESVRTPGRFGMLLGIPCVLLSVAIVRKIRDSSERIAARTVLGAMLLIESLPAFNTFDAPSLRLDRAEIVQRAVPTGAPVLVLPLVAKDHIATMQSVVSQLQEGFYHWRPLVVGYGNRTTPELEQLLAFDNDLRGRKVGAVQQMVTWAQRIDIHHLVVDTAAYSAEIRGELAHLESDRRITVVQHDGDLIAYSF